MYNNYLYTQDTQIYNHNFVTERIDLEDDIYKGIEVDVFSCEVSNHVIAFLIVHTDNVRPSPRKGTTWDKSSNHNLVSLTLYFKLS